MRFNELMQSRLLFCILGALGGCLLWMLCDDFPLVPGDVALAVGKALAHTALDWSGSKRIAQILLMLGSYGLRGAAYSIGFGAVIGLLAMASSRKRAMIYSAPLIPLMAHVATYIYLYPLEESISERLWQDFELNSFFGISIYLPFLMAAEAAIAVKRHWLSRRQAGPT